ncbi:hypothetical protein ILYODFUR_026111 [Ilyodon furcidens]|uniref:Uncharacterized protein n=1 Tax=Ilyodon furcidens TaxID=33524 RepID=A0ABV0SQN8_9TELE
MILKVKLLDMEFLSWFGYTWSVCEAGWMYSLILSNAYGDGLWWRNEPFTGNSSRGHFCCQHASCPLKTSVAMCYMINQHILEWPFIVASLRHTCTIIMLSKSAS